MEERNNKVRRSLSELPEKVLSHILSFLPTKEAVQTSVLSKRWEYIWTSNPKLLFDYGNELPMDFVNIVDRSLRLRGSFDITSFSLNCNQFQFDCEEVDLMSKIEAWFSSVVRFKVQDVELSLFGFSPLTLPFSFVNCRTLTSLIIYSGGITLEFPSPFCFSNLKKLKLTRVIFPNEYSTQKLFSGCPLLVDFKLEQCNWENVNAVSLISPPRLQNFTMIEDDDGQVPPGFNGDEFVISGGDLKYFHYEGEFQFEFNIFNSQPLEEVHINFYSPENGPMPIINNFLKLLRYTSDVPTLTLRNALCLLEIPEVVTQVPVFNGVRRLELDYETSDLSNKGLLMMLQNIPFLESLVFVEGIKMPSEPFEDNILDPLPRCFLYPLHFIYVYVKKGDVKELMGVKVLLENAMALVEMEIYFSELVNKDIRNNFCVELLKLPRGSRYCGIYKRQ
ncbi:hypothetical protein K1719_028096 [Acacia pycnantha]|nr:hypothetical protein K1719_028096 [Acacia pycnantha]